MSKPSVASYVVDFLKPEMHHVYRQIIGQKEVTPWILTHKRENADQFPFPTKRLVVMPKPALRWWRRIVHKHFNPAPWQLYRHELHHFLLTLTRIDARVLHIYFGHMALHLLPLIKAFPRPTVVSYHGADAGVNTSKAEYLAAMREVFASAAQIQARSQSLADDLIKLGCPVEKIHIQRTGIPLEAWPFQPRVPQPDQPCELIQCCRLIPKKGLDTTLNAFALIKKSLPQARLTIAGEGPLLAELQELTRTLDIHESVKFTGFLTMQDLTPLMYQSHIFLHPSRTGKDGNREGIPNSMLEAMASGCPVIATLHGGIPEAVTHEVNGLLVPSDDVQALADSILRIAQDSAFALELTHAARKTIEQQFDRAQNTATLEKAYLSLIDSHHKSAKR